MERKTLSTFLFVSLSSVGLASFLKIIALIIWLCSDLWLCNLDWGPPTLYVPLINTADSIHPHVATVKAKWKSMDVSKFLTASTHLECWFLLLFFSPLLSLTRLSLPEGWGNSKHSFKFLNNYVFTVLRINHVHSLCPAFRTQSGNGAWWDTPITLVSGCRLEASLSNEAKLTLGQNQK